MIEKLEDKTLTCDECGKSFIFPGRIKVSDLASLEEKDAILLLSLRDNLSHMIKEIDKNKQAKDYKKLQEKYATVEQTIVSFTSGNSQEAYLFNELDFEPRKCHDCRVLSLSRKN